jgi:Ala-tRNA(Pro) deacylase
MMRRRRASSCRPQMPATRADLLAFLDGLGVATTTADHAPVFTVEESRSLRGRIPGAHSKNLFLKDKKDVLFLIVAREDAAIDLKRIHGVVGASGRVSFGKPDLLMETLGVPPGSVTPFAVINDTARRVKVVIDRDLMVDERLNFHPLENNATTTIARDGLLRFLEAVGHPPRILPLAAETTAETAPDTTPEAG